MTSAILAILITISLIERLINMNALQTKIAALQAAVTALAAENASNKVALAQAKSDLATAQANAFSQADLDAIQAVTDAATAAV